MKRCVALVVLADLCTGCVAMQTTPNDAVLRPLQTIAVIPAESHLGQRSPLLPAGVAQKLVSKTPPLIPLPIVLAPIGLTQAIRQDLSVTEGQHDIASGPPPEAWMPVVDLAQASGLEIQLGGARTAHLFGGHLNLSVAAGSDPPSYDQWGTHFKRWYNEEVASVDSGSLGNDCIDAILEVGAMEDYQKPWAMQVFVKRIDPVTKEVLGRARNFNFPVHSYFGRRTPDEQRCLIEVTG